LIRLLHLADTHLGVESYGRLDSATGLSSRLGDFLAVLDQVVDYAVAQRVDLVVFAGDAYKTRDPSPTHQREFARRIRRLCLAGIPCFLLVGNHDLPNAQSRAHTTEIFDTLGVPGVTVARQIGTHRVETASGPLQVVSLPWVTRGSMLTREESRGQSLEELNTRLVEKVADALAAEMEALDPAIPAILVGHCTVEGAVYGSEKSVMLGQDVVLPISLLVNPNLDYVALGHIHKFQLLAQQPPVVYSGSLERIDFGEEAEPKGFLDVTLSDPGNAPGDAADWQGPRATYRFVPVNARRFLTIDVKVSSGDPTRQTLESIAEHDVAGAVVRVQVHNDTDIPLREPDVRQALKEAYFVAAVAQEMKPRRRRQLVGAAMGGLAPRDALAAYLEARDTPRERQELLLARAGALLGAQAAASGL
jgi:DNA repair protein SbcD/Mre11